MRIALIVLWWLAVGLTIAHFLLSKTGFSGKDFYIHGISSILIFTAGPIGLHGKIPALFYGGYIALIMEWFWKVSFLSDLIRLGEGIGFSNRVFVVWMTTLLVISVILLLGAILLFQQQSPLKLGKHLLSVSPERVRFIRNSIPVSLGLMGVFIFFNIRMQEYNFIVQDWIKIAVFVAILIIWMVGSASSRSPMLLLAFYLTFGVFLFFTATSVSFTYNAITMAFNFGISQAIGTSYYQAFLASALYLLVSLPMFVVMVRKLQITVSDTQQLDQF